MTRNVAGDRESPVVRRLLVAVVEGVDPLLRPHRVGLHLVPGARPVERKVVRRAVGVEAEGRDGVLRRGDRRLASEVSEGRGPGGSAGRTPRRRTRGGCCHWRSRSNRSLGNRRRHARGGLWPGAAEPIQPELGEPSSPRPRRAVAPGPSRHRHWSHHHALGSWRRRRDHGHGRCGGCRSRWCRRRRRCPRCCLCRSCRGRGRGSHCNRRLILALHTPPGHEDEY